MKSFSYVGSRNREINARSGIVGKGHSTTGAPEWTRVVGERGLGDERVAVADPET